MAGSVDHPHLYCLQWGKTPAAFQSGCRNGLCHQRRWQVGQRPDIWTTVSNSSTKGLPNSISHSKVGNDAGEIGYIWRWPHAPSEQKKRAVGGGQLEPKWHTTSWPSTSKLLQVSCRKFLCHFLLRNTLIKDTSILNTSEYLWIILNCDILWTLAIGCFGVIPFANWIGHHKLHKLQKPIIHSAHPRLATNVRFQHIPAGFERWETLTTPEPQGGKKSEKNHPAVSTQEVFNAIGILVWWNLVDLIAPRRWDLVFRSSSWGHWFDKSLNLNEVMSHGYEISRTLPHASPCTHVQTRHWAYACLENHIEPQNQNLEIDLVSFIFWSSMCPVLY